MATVSGRADAQEADAGYAVIEGAPASDLNAYISVFDIDSSATGASSGVETGVPGAKDISPVRIEKFIRVDPDALSRCAFTEVPAEMLRNISGTDAIMASIRSRLGRLLPGLIARI